MTCPTDIIQGVGRFETTPPAARCCAMPAMRRFQNEAPKVRGAQSRASFGVWRTGLVRDVPLDIRLRSLFALGEFGRPP